MIDIKEKLIEALHNKDKSRSRSKQTQIGPSELGGCAKKVWYRLNDQEITNHKTKKLAAIMGTAVHKAIEEAFQHEDPTAENYAIETEVEAYGIKSHIDFYIPSTGQVVDWKTVKIKNLSYFPSRNQRWQIQTYAHLLKANGYDVKTVQLVAIARDGDEDDIKVHTEDYDPAVAEEALQWLENIRSYVFAPEPEKDAAYCKSYCQFYDETGKIGCAGLKKELTKPSEVVIEDEIIDNDALLYIQLGNQIDSLEDQRDAIKASFEGVFGRTKSGVEISWTTVAGRQSIDSEKVKQLLGEVPMKPAGKESVRLNIKQIGA